MFAALVVCRWLDYGLAMFMFGASTFLWGLAPRRLAGALHPLARWLTLAAGLTLATASAWLFLEAGTMGDGWADMVRPETVGAVLFETTFGHAWRIHEALLLCVLAALAVGRGDLAWPASSAALASLGLIGHAATQSGPIGWLHRATLAVHLLAGGFWLGALVPLVPTIRHLGDPAMRHDAIVALRRFSRCGSWAVVGVVATGLGNTLAVLGRTRIDVSAPYQALLAAKVALVVAMIGLALVNRYRLVPLLRDRPDTARALARNSLAALIMGGVVVALVSALGLLEPQPT